ncbi:hypothetical protein [Chryseobacterium sp. ON_d1]|uniref:hypothetical protein n=1 Tax=Chryseobacterium sp. ON_d1 TaxID=2583211 RepID=UPI00115B940E|nr:hypothetical protein [Chryseobacterium sp. ON_d1]GEJ46009.1 hypothetical protein CRS_26170 [Chryseobacterium sp. ON_d1]
MKKIKKHKVRIYQDSKELPFYNYKRIIQTGDFFYMVKGYEAGDRIDFDASELEKKFDSIIQDFALSQDTKNEDIINYSNYLIAVNEIGKLEIVLQIIDLVVDANEKRKALNINEDNETIKDLLSKIKVQKNEDPIIQKQKIKDKIQKFKNQVEKAKSSILKSEKEEEEIEYDIDEQYISVCLGLEIHVDPKLISLYEFGVMVKMLVSKVEAINKSNNNAR